MADTVENLVLDLLEFVARRERSYDEVMSAWRTSCPRLPVWEDAIDRGLVKVHGGMVRITPAGVTLLERQGRLETLRGFTFDQ